MRSLPALLSLLVAGAPFGVLATPLAAAAAAADAAPAIGMPPEPARYNGEMGTFLYSGQNGPPYAQVTVNAIGGRLLFDNAHPEVVCPCSKDFGARNFTGYFAAGTSEAPTLQLFSNSPGIQQVYVDRDLSLRYTLPGEPIPPGANATSITSYDNEPLGSGLPSGSSLVLEGSVTQTNGTKTPYNSLIFCVPPGEAPSRKNENGPGPLWIFAYQDPESQEVPAGCISGAVFTSFEDPQVAPYDIVFRAPAAPLVEFYL